MNIQFEAKLPDDMTDREKACILETLLGDMTRDQIIRTVYEMLGSEGAAKMAELHKYKSKQK